MDQDIFALVGKYGFKALHSRLNEIMRSEYEYLREQFTSQVHVPVVATIQAPVNTVVTEKQKKPRKQHVKKVKFADPALATPQVAEPVVSETDGVEVKDVIVMAPVDRQGFRDPKEVKAFQKAGEEERHKLNETAGLQLSQILTKENLKQWIEVDGHTYAWVAREKAGCPDTQVAATAQMMGIKSTFSKKRAMMMKHR
jgi:hypothetical protein